MIDPSAVNSAISTTAAHTAQVTAINPFIIDLNNTTRTAPFTTNFQSVAPDPRVSP